MVVSLDAVCDRTGSVVSLPVTVDHRQRRFDVRALIDLETVFAGLDAEDRTLRLRLRAVWNNASWETTLARPEGGAPPFELQLCHRRHTDHGARQGREMMMGRSTKRRRRPAYVNASRAHLREAVRRFARGTKRGMLVLDAGAGTSPYRKLFKHARYEAADFAELGTKYAPLDYVCDLTDIPVEDGRFDRVLFNQVLEHLPAPGAAMAELHRVLRPGGRLFLLCAALLRGAPKAVRLLSLHPVLVADAGRGGRVRGGPHRVARGLSRHRRRTSSSRCTAGCPATSGRSGPLARAGGSSTWRR